MHTDLILMLLLLAAVAGLEYRLRRATRNLRQIRIALLRATVER